MKRLVIARIREIGDKQQNFSPSLYRWQTFRTGISDKHISQYGRRDLLKLDDNVLLFLYERIIQRCSVQMSSV